MLGTVLGAWSPRRNAKSLVTRTSSQAWESPLDGLRALSALWVLVTHAFLTLSYVYPGLRDIRLWLDMYDHFAMRVVHNGQLGVDIFFLLSGYLILLILRRPFQDNIERDASRPLLSSVNSEDIHSSLASPSTPMPPTPTRPSSALRISFNFYGRRLFRIVPAYFASLLVYFLLMEHTPFPPAFKPIYDALAAPCKDSWWHNLLFINNFYPYNEMCMAWSWTIAIEIQMYLVSPPIVYLVVRYPRMALPLLGSLCGLSVALYSGLSAWVYVDVRDGGSLSFTDIVYEKTYTRMFAYFAGMIVALIVHDERQSIDSYEFKSRPSRIWSVVRPALSISLVLVVAFCADIAPPIDPFWKCIGQVVLTRPLFVLGMALVMYEHLSPHSMYSKYIEWSTKVLGSRPFYVLAQLSYSVYLLHISLMLVLYFKILHDPVWNGDLEFNPRWMFPVFTLFFYVLSNFASMVMYFVLEKPLINIGAVLFK